jgi:hypothetical protein
MNRLLKIGLVITASISPLLVAAMTPSSPASFDEANKAYQTGHFSQAREIYKSLQATDPNDPSLDYNLANTYYRLDERGRAILCYERALALRPYDEDVRYNLALVKSSLKQTDENPLEKFFRTPTASGLLWASTVFLWIWVNGLMAFLFKKDFNFPKIKRPMILAGVLWCLLVTWGGIRLWDESRPWGIIVVKQAQIRSGPGTDFAIGATAPEGLRVLVLNVRDGWALVGLTKAGIQGWVPADNVERIHVERINVERK